VKHIIEAHQQTILVKSAVDEGTTFTFTLAKVK
jgi:two-component system phosphate regulon sensor histidine kinase PhoR